MRRLPLTALLLLAATPLAGITATTAPAVLGNEGEILRVVTGPLSQVLPGSAGSAPALALEIVRPGKPVERHLVPGTGDLATEDAPAITLDRASNTAFVVWEAQQTIHSTLHLAAFGAGEWSEVFELSGDPFSAKSNPRMTATSEVYPAFDEAGEVVSRRSITLHLTWWDEGALGGRPLYAPLVVEDGAFVPSWLVLPLSDFLPDAGQLGNGPLGLYSSPRVVPASDGRSAVIAFGDRAGNRVAAIEARPVSGSLISVADQARAQIIETGRRHIGDRRSFADQARAQIIETGSRLVDAEVAAFLAARAAEVIAASGQELELEVVADQARAQIIETGSRLSAGPRMMVDKARAQIIETGRSGRGKSHLSLLRLASLRATPWVPERAIRILASGEGDEVALAWDVDGAIRYRQSQGDGWSEVRTLALDAALDREAAYELIEKRLKQR